MATIYVYTGADDNGDAHAASRDAVSKTHPNPIQLVGLAYVNQRRGSLTSTFAYSHEYLQSPLSCAIDPELPLQSGNWPLAHELPGALMDSTPDRWGRNLINKRYPGQRLNNLDYLLGVSDITRQGALRFKREPGEAFQYPDARVPKLIELSELLDAARAIDSPGKGEEAVRFLLEAGSGSLGGARPKAAVEKDGQLYMAKFPHKNDKTDVIANEYQALCGAKKLGMDVPECELIKIGESKVLLVKRFDRHVARGGTTVGATRSMTEGATRSTTEGATEGATERILYISAMTALGAVDGEQRDYLEILDFISRFGSRPKQDSAELLRRIRYTIEINNTDDHLRNHGFLYEKGGWHLSPLFDINPNPDRNEARQTALGGHTDSAGSLQVLEELEQQQQ